MSDQHSVAFPGSRALLLSILAILGSASVGFLSYHLLLHRRSSMVPSAVPSSPSNSAGGSEIGAAGAPRPTKMPETLPDIELRSADGSTHRLTDWKGHDLIINFWATWCEPCRREIPLLQTLRRENAAKSLEVVGIAVDYADEVHKYASQHGIDYPLLVGEREGLEAANAFGMETVLPFSVFSDREGRIVTMKVGELHRDEADFILGRIREVDAGRLALASARAQISEGVRKLRQAHAADPG